MDLEKFAADHADAAYKEFQHTSDEERCNIGGLAGKRVGENMYSKWVCNYWDRATELSQLEMAEWSIMDLCGTGQKYNYDSPTFDAGNLPERAGENLPLHFTQVRLHLTGRVTPRPPFR